MIALSQSTNPELTSFLCIHKHTLLTPPPNLAHDEHYSTTAFVDNAAIYWAIDSSLRGKVL